MNSPEQLKGLIRNFAKDKNVSAQEVLQMFMFERLIERISISEYNNNFILKGGLLVASMIGISERTTMDMDTTIKGLPVDEDTIVLFIKNIINLDINDGIRFHYNGIQSIRTHDEYNNFSISITAIYEKIRVPLKIDVTTGDSIIPKEIHYEYNFILNHRKVLIYAYSLETILAEKIETIISKGMINTRSRDFYDVFILHKLKSNEIKWSVLKEALVGTTKKRDSLAEIREYRSVLKEIKESEIVKMAWIRYQNDNIYAREIELTSTLEIIDIIFDKLKFY